APDPFAINAPSKTTSKQDASVDDSVASTAAPKVEAKPAVVVASAFQPQKLITRSPSAASKTDSAPAEDSASDSKADAAAPQPKDAPSQNASAHSATDIASPPDAAQSLAPLAPLAKASVAKTADKKPVADHALEKEFAEAKGQIARVS